MSATLNNNKFKWIGDEIECCDPQLKKRKRTFYASCSLNDQIYNIGDYAVVKGNSTKTERNVCKILHMFELRERGYGMGRFCGLVRWYAWVRNLKIAGYEQYSLNNTNEIAEDQTKVGEISLEQLSQICYVFFAMPDDSECLRSNFDLHFPCRFKITDKGLQPIFSESTSPTLLEAIEHAHLTLHRKKSNTDYEIAEEAIVIMRDDCLDHVVTPSRNCAKLKSSSSRTPRAKSTCVIKQVAFADHISPVNKSPSKRGRSFSTHSESSTSYNMIAKQPRNTRNTFATHTFKQHCVSKEDNDLEEKKSSPLKRSRTISRSNESIPSLLLSDINIDHMSNCVVKLQDNIKTSPKKVQRKTLSETGISRNITKLLRSNEISFTKHSPQSLNESVYSDLLKNTVCKVEQLDSNLIPKKSDDCDNTIKEAKTPRAKIKLIREGLITPSMPARSTPIKAKTTPLNKAKTQLHVSYVPNTLPCRETEFNDIFNFIKGKLLDNCGGCMYVSGVPGAGKTATVIQAIEYLQALVKTHDIPGFRYVNLNGMKLTEPRQAYVEILKQLTGKTLAWESARNTLDVKFTKVQKNCEPIILVVDEFDILCTKRQHVVYNLLDWPSRANMPLIIITIANTMDLPERYLIGRVSSRLGLTRLTFQAYTYKQLEEIVTKRLVGTNAFDRDAIQLVARKVASISGDARRALDICRRAAEIAELENKDALVSMSHVNEALDAMITNPKIKAIRHCPRLQQLILQAVVSEVERTSMEETTFLDMFTMLESLAVLDGFQMVSSTVARRAVSNLGAYRLLLLDQKSSDIHQKVMLNVSPDDVYYALRKD